MHAQYIFTIDPHVIRSINKSILRKKVLLHLDSVYPNADYLANIARAIGSDSSNVLGCIRGMGNRYNGNSSLIELGLIEVIERDGYKYYKITELGKRVVKYIREVYGGI
ncbi:hypothetical protein DRP04_12175 [Archaeoglobales archaeon]|mgnify:CR=1 FL=1|nr:MAG: hypothetical protein DRP04_12175 [Archaeoglobales archaeon]